MPMQESQSALFAKLMRQPGAAKAVAEARAKPVQWGSAGLPAGLVNAIAQLRTVSLGEFQDGANKGKMFFQAMGVCLEPEEFNGVKCAGQQTRISPEPLCDTPAAATKRKTYAEHMGFFLSFLRVYAGEEAVASLPSEEDPEGFAAGLAELCRQLSDPQGGQPCFRFRTYTIPKDIIEERGGKWHLIPRRGLPKVYPSKDALLAANKYADSEPRVIHEWQDRVEHAANVDPGAGTVDETGSLTNGEDGNGGNHAQDQEQVLEDAYAKPEKGFETQVPDIDDAPATEAAKNRIKPPPPGSRTVAQAKLNQGKVTPSGNGPTVAKTTAAVQPSKAPSPAKHQPVDDQLPEDLAQLGLAAADDKAARKKLLDIALAAGLTQQQVKDADDWAQVAEMIQSAWSQKDSVEQEAVEEEETGEELVEEEDADDGSPKVGMEVKFNPLNSATGKRLTVKSAKSGKTVYAAAVVGMVKAVNAEFQTMDVQGADGKVNKSVPWAALVTEG